MASFNKVILLGNVTRDFECRYLAAGTAVADFSLAINNNFTAKDGTKREEVTFVEVTFSGGRLRSRPSICGKVRRC